MGDYVWSIEVAEVDWGAGRDPWKPGVHLFSVMLLAAGGHQSGTIATALIDADVKRVKPDLSVAARFAAEGSARQGRR